MPNPCEGKMQLIAEFSFKEIIGDSVFVSDTVLRDNFVRFEALTQYQTVKRKIENDPREFTQPTFTLGFIRELATIQISFTGTKEPNKQYFPNDNGVYSGIKKLTTIEQFDKSTLTFSPLIGKYRGYFINNPSDKFTVRIEYFESSKYDPSITRNKNFYWISNIPKRYKDSTSSAALAYQELKNGMAIEMG